MHPSKTIEETADEIEKVERKFKKLTEKHGIPMTQEKYEERSKKRGLGSIR